MTAIPDPKIRVIIYEGAGSEPLPSAARAEALRSLLEHGYAVSCMRAGGRLSSVNSATLVVLGKFLEAKPPSALSSNGDTTIYFQDIGGMDAAAVVEAVENKRSELHLEKPGAWKPWFPVIDFSRCTNCMQCLSFCLFDVYGVSAGGKIEVRNQSNCKTDCPACSRVCPDVAILFPKYRHGPINGDVVSEDDIRREAMKVDISALLGGDIYAALRDRSAKAKSRFSAERDDERALKERQTCLLKLKEQLDIPAEVIASLPTLDQIRAKADEALARARAEQQRSGANPAPAPN